MPNPFQNTYSENQDIGLVGGLVAGEEFNAFSRTVETVGGIAWGAPAFQGAADRGCVAVRTATAAGSAAAGNTGNGTITASPATTVAANRGRYVVTMIEPGANAGTFEVTNPGGEVVGRGTVAVAFSGGGLTFTIADGATDFVAGDQFYVDVTAEDFLGVTRRNPAVPFSAAGDKYAQYSEAAVVDYGVIWGRAGGNVAPRGQAYWNPTTSRWTADATQLRCPGVIFDTTATDGNLVALRVRRNAG